MNTEKQDEISRHKIKSETGQNYKEHEKQQQDNFRTKMRSRQDMGYKVKGGKRGYREMACRGRGGAGTVFARHRLKKDHSSIVKLWKGVVVRSF